MTKNSKTDFSKFWAIRLISLHLVITYVGKESEKQLICICITDSLCHTPEINTNWEINSVLSRSVMSHFFQPHGLWLAKILGAWGFSRQESWNGLPCSPPGKPAIFQYKIQIEKNKLSSHSQNKTHVREASTVHD